MFTVRLLFVYCSHFLLLLLYCSFTVPLLSVRQIKKTERHMMEDHFRIRIQGGMSYDGIV